MVTLPSLVSVLVQKSLYQAELVTNKSVHKRTDEGTERKQERKGRDGVKVTERERDKAKERHGEWWKEGGKKDTEGKRDRENKDEKERNAASQSFGAERNKGGTDKDEVHIYRS